MTRAALDRWEWRPRESRLRRVIRVCDVEMPDAGEVCRVLGIAAGRRAKESKRGAVAIACDHGGKRNVLDTERCSNIGDVRPGSAVIMRNRDHGMAIAAVPAKIDGIV